MIFKAVSGAKENAFNTYNSGETLAENDMSALDVITKTGDYKNRIILNWAEFSISEVIRKRQKSARIFTFHAFQASHA